MKMWSHGSGATGLMQIMEDTAKEIAETIGMEDMDLKEPKCNIEIGTKYFKTLLDYYRRKLPSGTDSIQCRNRNCAKMDR